MLAAVAMIMAVLPLAGAAANEEGNKRVVDLIADGGADAPAVPVDVGDAIIWDDGTNLYVDYEIDTDLPDTWCITKTHIAVGLTEADIPQTKKGNPVPGSFEFTGVYDLCETSIPIVIPMEVEWMTAGTDLAVAVHADVEVPGGLEGVEYFLPDTVSLRVQWGAVSYFGAYITNGGILDNDPPNVPYVSWCVDIARHISLGHTYDLMDVYSSYEDLPTGTVDYPWNMDSVNWLINYMNVDAEVTGTDGALYTVNKRDVAYAIWELTDDSYYRGWGTYRAPLVAAMVDAALTDGDGFEPGCNDKIAIIFSNIDAKLQSTVIQTTFAELGVPCEARTETAWGGDWDFAEWAFDFPFTSKKWSGYFEYTVGPVPAP